MNENINSDNNFENIQDDFPYRNNFNNSEENKSMNFYSNRENTKKKKVGIIYAGSVFQVQK